MTGPVQVTLVGGFLGAGKTTYIARRLLPGAGDSTCVVLNELGRGDTEGSLFGASPPRLIAGGCVCCDRRDELKALLRNLVGRTRAARPSHIIIELTGMAHPERIAQQLIDDPLLRYHTALRAIVVVVDALALRQTLSRHHEAVAQIAAADRVVVSKTDLCDPATASDAVALVRHINPDVGVDGLAGDVPPKLSDEAPLAVTNTGAHTADVRTVTLEFCQPLTWQVFGAWLTLLVHAHGERLLRFKARIDTGGEGPVLLDAVQDVVHPPRHLVSWSGLTPSSSMTFISRGLDLTRLEASLTTFEHAFAQLAADPGRRGHQSSR
jgi:G3E family GTPase